MSDRYRCRVEDAIVRPEKREALEGLVRKLFERRHHGLIGGREKDWLTVELVQSLRAESQVYQEELSTKTDGPLPFALGYFQVRGNRLTLVSDEVPANVPPETFVRFVSEFVQVGATFWFGDEEGDQAWTIRGVGEVERGGGTAGAAPRQVPEDESAGANN
ncbi:hypothetical protein GGP84_001080 [Salinibacter ruber]|uniref:hypothetical protein n=1 Tax=Salinibacter ruber TaxID=146919 RepID=UPI002167579B|nr:hypothetical protein [Salinibacter ruber]MCS3938465.1 hypothetical protein [Salinibacter ruber]